MNIASFPGATRATVDKLLITNIVVAKNVQTRDLQDKSHGDLPWLCLSE